jgi:hypothetical protein
MGEPRPTGCSLAQLEAWDRAKEHYWFRKELADRGRLARADKLKKVRRR